MGHSAVLKSVRSRLNDEDRCRSHKRQSGVRLARREQEGPDGRLGVEAMEGRGAVDQLALQIDELYSKEETVVRDGVDGRCGTSIDTTHTSHALRTHLDAVHAQRLGNEDQLRLKHRVDKPLRLAVHLVRA